MIYFLKFLPYEPKDIFEFIFTFEFGYFKGENNLP
jgi:hypothetical protein